MRPIPTYNALFSYPDTLLLEQTVSRTRYHRVREERIARRDRTLNKRANDPERVVWAAANQACCKSRATRHAVRILFHLDAASRQSKLQSPDLVLRLRGELSVAVYFYCTTDCRRTRASAGCNTYRHALLSPHHFLSHYGTKEGVQYRRRVPGQPFLSPASSLDEISTS